MTNIWPLRGLGTKLTIPPLTLMERKLKGLNGLGKQEEDSKEETSDANVEHQDSLIK